MRHGNELDQIVGRVRKGQPVEALWSLLRNLFFRAGTPSDGWKAMEAWFNDKGVNAVEVRRYDPQSKHEVISVLFSLK